MTTNALVTAAERITGQLDTRGNPDLAGLPETLCRALKVQEEAGEMAQAVIGVLGQNPRKGVTHTWDDVVNEAIDTALSALVLAETVRPGMLGLTLAGRLDHLQRRAADCGAPDTEPTAATSAPGGDRTGQRQAATLRWLLDVHAQHGLPVPEDICSYSSTLRLNLGNDQADGVRRWAAFLGLPAEERQVHHGGNQWIRVNAETPWGADTFGLGWKHIEIVTTCDHRPITDETPMAVAA